MHECLGSRISGEMLSSSSCCGMTRGWREGRRRGGGRDREEVGDGDVVSEGGVTAVVMVAAWGGLSGAFSLKYVELFGGG